MLLFYFLIVFIWSAECSRNQREHHLIGGDGERKMRFKRALGGTRKEHHATVGTLWRDKVRYRDAFADSRFYGVGTVLNRRYILAQKESLQEIMVEDNKGNFWDKHIQFADFTTKEYHKGEINVTDGARKRDGSRKRDFGLKYIGDATKWFGIAKRLDKEHNGKGFDPGPYGTTIWTKRKDLEYVGRNCSYVGWSKELQNGTKQASIRYWVEIPVQMIKNSCKEHVCQFHRSDGLPGGFCNTYQESGSSIHCNVNGDRLQYVHFLVVQDPKRAKIVNCTGRASAYHVPYLMDAVKKFLEPVDGPKYVELA